MDMKKVFYLGFSILILMLLLESITTCQQKTPVKLTNTNKYTICLDGVTYYKFTELGYQTGYGFFGAKFDRNGNIVTCNSIKEK